MMRCYCSLFSLFSTGAMDFRVHLHQLDAIPSTHPPHPPPNSTPLPVRRSQHEPAALQPVQAHTTVYACHRARVKHVEVEVGNPHLFFSAAEDGFVRQYDRRMRCVWTPVALGSLVVISGGIEDACTVVHVVNQTRESHSSAVRCALCVRLCLRPPTDHPLTTH